MIDAAIVAKIVAELIRVVRAGQRESHPSSFVTIEHREQAFFQHLRYIESWCSTQSVPKPMRGIDGSSFYIPLFLQPDQSRGRQAIPSTVTPEKLLEPGKHSVILGEPGAGKTTIVRQLCHTLLKSSNTAPADTFDFPLLVQARDLAETETVKDRLLSNLGIECRLQQVSNNPIEDQRLLQRRREEILVKACDNHSLLLLIDGLDEVPPHKRTAIIAELSSLTHLLEQSSIITTARFASLESPIKGARTFAVKPFDKSSISAFLERWFQSIDDRVRFRNELERSSYNDVASNPLHLYNLCMVFESSGRLPDRPIKIYEAIINIRLEQWDRERGVQRGSSYADFGPDTKRRFLAALCFRLATKKIVVRFDRTELIDAYLSVCESFSLPRNEAQRVAEEIESHSGLIIQCNDSIYEFYHTTVFEYLCADYLSRSQLDFIQVEAILVIPEAAAIATTLSAASDRFFATLALRMRVRHQVYWPSNIENIASTGLDFWKRYFTRLLQEGIQIPRTPLAGLGMLMATSSCWITRNVPGARATIVPQGGRVIEIVHSTCDKLDMWEAVNTAMNGFEIATIESTFVIIRATGRFPPELPHVPTDSAVDRILLARAGLKACEGGEPVDRRPEPSKKVPFDHAYDELDLDYMLGSPSDEEPISDASDETEGRLPF